MSRDEKIAEFLARKGATICPPAEGNARSLRKMRRDIEAGLSRDGGKDPMYGLDLSERASERRREAYGRARAAGFSVSDALDEARDAS